VEDYKEDLADYFGRTVVHPAGATLCALLALALFFVPRRWAFLPLVLLACFVSSAQRVMVAGLNFDFLRLLVMAGWIRVLVRGEARGLAWNLIDTCVLLYAVIGVTTHSVLHADWDAVKYRLGWAYDVIGLYFLCRFLLQGLPDPRLVAKAFVVASVPVAIVFAIEYATHRNLFSVLGGVPETTWMRGGRLRCQGPFAHPIIAGVFWASQLPLVASLWTWGGRWRTWSVVGMLAMTFTVATTNSSTSLMAAIFAGVAMCAFPLRRRMAFIRWGAVLAIVALHMVMKAPVWHLLARATVLDASTGWHRFYVIDQSIRHLDEWWLLGTKSTESWDVTDLTNEYVFVGVEAGAFALAAFLVTIALCFRRVGLRCAQLEANRPACWTTWALGASLFVHCTNFIGVAYFGQARLVWYLALALIASQPLLAHAPAAAAAAVRTRGARRPARGLEPGL
jgi:hypothetical protein